jgi:hypothetical protein
MVMMLGPVKQALPKKDESEEGEGADEAAPAEPEAEAVEAASSEDDSAA